MVHFFVPAEGYLQKVAILIEEHRSKILRLVPTAQVEHIGATSVPLQRFLIRSIHPCRKVTNNLHLANMPIDPLSDAKIIDSWYKNATPWIVAIQEHQIESRNLITNGAIFDAIISCDGNKVLDIGCGEGWLARELSLQGMQVLGVDIVSELIDRAQLNVSDARFKVLSYEAIAAEKLAEKFDVAVANFSLLGEESVTGLFRSMRSILNPQGRFIVQTTHPAIACGDRPYLDGWRSGSWAGFSNDFTDPAPWYFRTLATWISLYISNGFSLIEIREPIHPHTGKPASAIFIGILLD